MSVSRSWLRNVISQKSTFSKPWKLFHWSRWFVFLSFPNFFWGFILQAGNSWLFLANGSVGACFSRFENSQILENLFILGRTNSWSSFLKKKKMDFYVHPRCGKTLTLHFCQKVKILPHWDVRVKITFFKNKTVTNFSDLK